MNAIEEATRALAAAIAEAIVASGPSASAADRLLSIPEAAAALGVGRSTVYKEIAVGRLRTIKVGRRRLVPSGAIAAYTGAA